MISEYLWCQDGGYSHLGLSKIRNFNGRSAVGSQCASSCQMSSKSVKLVQRYGDLTVFKMAAVRHLGLVKFEFFKERLRDPFCISVLNFVKIGQTVAEISRFLWFFKMAAAAILDFQKIGNFNGRSTVWCQCASLYQISSKSVKRLQRYGDLTFFSKCRPSAILDLFGAYWDHPWRPLDGLYLCAKCGWNWCSSFDNMKLNILPVLLENAYSRPQNWDFRGILPPKWGTMSTKPPKGTSLCESTSFEPPSVKIRRPVWPVGDLMKKRYK